MLRNTNVEVPKPEGAFYLFVPVETDDNIGLCESLLTNENVAATSGFRTRTAKRAYSKGSTG
jgi:aspartate/methionine/tyrosine aminotransferase